MTAPDLERRLATLASAVDWPEPLDVSDAVAAGIRSRTARTALPAWAARWRPAVAAAAAVLLVIAGALVVSPAAREAVAALLGVAGIEVRSGGEVTPPGVAGFRLGEPVTLTEAQRRVDFPVRLLDLDGDLERVGGGVYLDDRVPGGIVHIFYAEQPGLPEAMPKDVGALLTQFRARPDPYFTKEAVGATGQVTVTEVAGQFALWVTGPSHVLVPNRGGEPVRDEARLAANALLWTTPGGVTYRLETALSLAPAVALAETLH